MVYFTFLIVTKKIWEKISGIKKLKQTKLIDSSINNDEKIKNKILFRYSIFYVLHGIGFIGYLHWFTAIYFFSILIIFYCISLLNDSKLNPVSFWLFLAVFF